MHAAAGQPPGSPHSRPRRQQASSSPALGQSGLASHPKGPSRAIKVKKWPQRAKIQANPGQQPASSQISTFACFFSNRIRARQSTGDQLLIPAPCSEPVESC